MRVTKRSTDLPMMQGAKKESYFPPFMFSQHRVDEVRAMQLMQLSGMFCEAIVVVIVNQLLPRSYCFVVIRTGLSQAVSKSSLRRGSSDFLQC